MEDSIKDLAKITVRSLKGKGHGLQPKRCTHIYNMECRQTGGKRSIHGFVQMCCLSMAVISHIHQDIGYHIRESSFLPRISCPLRFFIQILY